MTTRFQRITPFLWFADEAEEAAKFYVSIFENSKITTTTRYGKEAAQATGRPEGSAMTVGFQLDGQDFTALNGGPVFKFNEAMSLVVHCRSQAEVDRYWKQLSEGGDERSQQCGWLKDRYGVSWQVVPDQMIELLSHPDRTKAQKAMAALMQMKKIDLHALQQAAA
ncbi:VOC family protein [Dyella subtropica]|uniref:VOC family protein n=1 Tax=Dyella subtropica TaxID=2992127 RepID=UPI00225B8061|nr:VOC family protein [Dyella subtropica]